MQKDLEKKLIEHAINPSTQIVRLIDVAIIAPFTIIMSFKKDLPQWQRITLLTIGVATLFYNLSNYIKIKKLTKEIDEANVSGSAQGY